MRSTIFKIFILVFGLSFSSYSQDFSALWKGHFSYNSIVDVVGGENKIYAAAQNAVFEYNTLTNELKTITTVDGLSGQQITTIYYSETYQYLLIGYETGLIEVYSETEDTVLTVVDILDKPNITPVNKRINHFYEFEGLVYISTDYGISIYDLEGLEFGDSYFLGNGGTQITVKQVAILNGEIYVACLDANGLKKADLNNPNLIDFAQWQTVLFGNYHSVNTFNNKVYAVRSNRVLYEIDGTTTTNLFTLASLPLDADVVDSFLLYSTSNAVYVYDQNLQLLHNYQPTQDFLTNFTSATITDDEIFIGTKDLGVLNIPMAENQLYTVIKPNGPLANEVFRLNATTGVVWVSYGKYTAALNPYPLTSKGVSYYSQDLWNTIPVDSLFGTLELNEIAVNPFNTNHVFISSFHEGIVELNEFEATQRLDETNSGLESYFNPNNPDATEVRVSALEFDRNGLLWSLTSRVDAALKTYDPTSGNWQAYSFSDIIDDPFTDETGFFDMAIDNNGTKWIGSYSNGLIAYNETVPNSPIRNLNSEAQNISPYTRFIAVTMDNRNQLWLGTTNGIRVLYNTSGFYDDPNPILRSIIILEDGIPKELLEGQSVTDIKVDGSNNKWVGTADSGVFYFSPDGQKTIYHFTTTNSPLPSNRINDISINPNNGEIYIGTDKGLMSFKAGSSKPQSTLEEAFVYPNPVRPEYDILGYNDLNDINKGIKIKGLTDRVNIKITDVEGNLVAEAQSNINLRASNSNYNFAIDGGTAIWNGKNLANNVVRTGVYLIMISDLESFETKVLKVLIVR
ncbi:hypothetical protein DFQ11_101554 [Winogradskyella epiphytica]|uniref:PorZ N-terminal beta-propeller domain-containing protein n=1 Tax=Winogradskyella epiphytica TaxID=262005 RepID=A0A2V4YGS9_9FLAO|nr:ABC transporter substrate-binding protein [Winogradskyella epiphytica]PYE83123.1 hypothetical protein DFQ11_101554 [Winogradskyella epiphytica]GGW55956.1 ABC transporter substrate-binding protein [Winogradskyella epiphytica]